MALSLRATKRQALFGSVNPDDAIVLGKRGSTKRVATMFGTLSIEVSLKSPHFPLVTPGILNAAVSRMLRCALESPCPSGRRHGCILCSLGVGSFFVAAEGFNKPTAKRLKRCLAECVESDRVLMGCGAKHAESAAVSACRKRWKDPAARSAWLARPKPPHAMSRLIAIVTKKPCAPCKHKLHGIGIAAIAWLDVRDWEDDATVTAGRARMQRS